MVRWPPKDGQPAQDVGGDSDALLPLGKRKPASARSGQNIRFAGRRRTDGLRLHSVTEKARSDALRLVRWCLALPKGSI